MKWTLLFVTFVPHVYPSSFWRAFKSCGTAVGLGTRARGSSWGRFCVQLKPFSSFFFLTPLPLSSPTPAHTWAHALHHPPLARLPQCVRGDLWWKECRVRQVPSSLGGLAVSRLHLYSGDSLRRVKNKLVGAKGLTAPKLCDFPLGINRGAAAAAA